MLNKRDDVAAEAQQADEPFDAFAGGFPVRPMPGQVREPAVVGASVAGVDSGSGRTPSPPAGRRNTVESPSTEGDDRG